MPPQNGYLLIRSGWPSSSLLLAELVVRVTGERHLILLVRERRAILPDRVFGHADIEDVDDLTNMDSHHTTRNMGVDRNRTGRDVTYVRMSAKVTFTPNHITRQTIMSCMLAFPTVSV